MPWRVFKIEIEYCIKPTFSFSIMSWAMDWYTATSTSSIWSSADSAANIFNRAAKMYVLIFLLLEVNQTKS